MANTSLLPQACIISVCRPQCLLKSLPPCISQHGITMSNFPYLGYALSSRRFCSTKGFFSNSLYFIIQIPILGIIWVRCLTRTHKRGKPRWCIGARSKQLVPTGYRPRCGVAQGRAWEWGVVHTCGGGGCLDAVRFIKRQNVRVIPRFRSGVSSYL